MENVVLAILEQINVCPHMLKVTFPCPETSSLPYGSEVIPDFGTILNKVSS